MRKTIDTQKKVALWKIIVPVFVFLFLLHCRVWHTEEEMLMHTAFSSGGYLGLNQKIVAVLMAITMCSWMAYTRKRSTGEMVSLEKLCLCFYVWSCRSRVVYQYTGGFSVLAEQLLYFRGTDP